MIVTHRSGEPEDATGSIVTAKSLIGIPNDKAEVTEDFLIEVAGYRRLMKSNDLYDTRFMPRFVRF